MKTLRLVLIFAFVALFIVPAVGFAQERILTFEASARVQENGDVLISEAITYDFEGNWKHGIYRDIPLTQSAQGQSRRAWISDIQVTDERGNAYPFDVSGSSVKSIKIGDPDQTIYGVHTYLITYTFHNAISILEGGDEFYWNVNGNEWDVPAEIISAKITLPQPIREEQMPAACYIGHLGSQQKCETIELVPGSATFIQDGLSAHSGLTIALGFPKGLVAGPSAGDAFMAFLTMFGWLIIPVIAFIYLFRKWWRGGRDAKGRGAIPVQYDAPAGLSPLAIGTLYDNSVGDRDITAEIVYLAQQGYLKIHHVEEKQLIVFKKTDYALIKLKEAGPELKEYQKLLLTSMFDEKYVAEATVDGVAVQAARVSKFGKNGFYKEIKEVQDSAYEWLATEGYYRANPNTVKIPYLSVGFGLVFASFWVATLSSFGIALILTGILCIVFGFAMPALTEKGVAAEEHILGLREYIDKAEKYRIEFHNAPEKNPQEFERLLPQAIALKVEKEWAKQFEGMSMQPQWYGGQVGTFNAIMLTSSLGDFRSMAGTSFKGSSGAGSGGMGGVGGGMGGGGGGSW